MYSKLINHDYKHDPSWERQIEDAKPKEYTPCPQCGKTDFISDFDYSQHLASCVRFR